MTVPPRRLPAVAILMQAWLLALALGVLIGSAPAPHHTTTWRPATPAEQLRWAMDHAQP